MEKLDLVKYAQLDLLIELKRICDKHNIEYFLVGGTLLGAIRHKGFIPWDDDIDVGMMRDQYDRFIKVCKYELDPAYSLYDWHIDESSPLPFLKMKINGTHYREKFSGRTDMNDGIFIDIFPFDNAPNNKFKRKIQATKNILIKKILLLKCGFTIDDGNGIVKKILYLPLRLTGVFSSCSALKKAYERMAIKYSKSDTEYVVSLGGAYAYGKELKKRELFSSFISCEFEGIQFNISKHYDHYLREIYGDYMQLPPASQRISRHGISLIDLGNYQVRSKK